MGGHDPQSHRRGAGVHRGREHDEATGAGGFGPAGFRAAGAGPLLLSHHSAAACSFERRAELKASGKASERTKDYVGRRVKDALQDVATQAGWG